MLRSNKIILLLAAICFLLSSCADFENNIYINEDGSGKVTMKYDASEMMAMMEMMKGMEEGGEGENTDQEIDEENEPQDLNSMMQGLGNPSNMVDMDSTFTFYSVTPDSIKQTLENPELLKNVTISMKTNKDEMTAVMGMELTYGSLEELEKTFQTLTELGDDTDLEKNEMDGFKELIRNYDADLETGIVTLPEQDFSGDFGDNGMGNEDIDFDNMSEEEAGMMQMMFGESGYVTTLHLPGEVLSCDDSDATIEGNTITIRDSYMTLMKEQKFKARTIKYKVK